LAERAGRGTAWSPPREQGDLGRGRARHRAVFVRGVAPGLAVAAHKQLAPAPLGNDLAVKHGAFAMLKLAPRAAEIADDLRAVVPAYSPADEPTVRLLALSLAQVEAATLYLAEHGFTDKRGKTQGVLRHLGTMMNTASRLCNALALTPTSRAKLGLNLTRTGDALRAHLDERYGGEEVVDGE
jgi:hypothetical protein